MMHTPTPWTIKPSSFEDELLILSDETCIASAPIWQDDDDNDTLRAQSYANAEFIVRACNCHDELAKALADLLGDRPNVQEQNGRFLCLHCGRDYGCSDDAPVNCDSDDCPAFKARALLARATGRGGQP